MNLTDSVDPGEMPHFVVFHLGLSSLFITEAFFGFQYTEG